MTNASIYKDIAERTGGDIYIGIVGPVRTGKSTFIKQFMDKLVLPNISGDYFKERANDELPQSSSGRTIMTTEPKFIPEKGAQINIDDNASMNVRLIDCVGYIVPSALGYIEGDQPRMVMTPWYEEPIPFNMAAEIGTRKVITEHSTIGLVITTDGSISDIPREEYAEAEERVIDELKAIEKPFIVLLNCMYPESGEAKALAAELTEKYKVPVEPVNCLELSDDDIKLILSRILFEFPIKEISICFPRWINSLPLDHWLRSDLTETIKKSASGIRHIRDIDCFEKAFCDSPNVDMASVAAIDLGAGCAEVKLATNHSLFYKILAETTGLVINDEQELMESMAEMAQIKKEYSRVKGALDEVEATGYGIIMPDTEELKLEEPEIVKQGGRYGVRLRASAPSIHLMKANITTEVSPIVGSEKQSEDLVMYLLSGFEEDPVKIWDSNIFGKSLHDLVNEGLHTKLARMPVDARMRVQETVERVINEGCNGLVCILL
ncbi:MAG: stage IV sporulation protein A [Clostridia bacterium]|nr:stage IV sporulation protein A [Oscillospiraceae bacterium]MBP3600591.1 stage IV sporulation protein A [Clostridia bacterium]